MRFIDAILTSFLFSFLTSFVVFAGEDSQERDLEADRAVERQCLECHNNPALFGSRPDGAMRSVHVDTERYRRSVHYEKDYTCLTCHPDAKVEYHPREGVRIRSCGDCHDHEDELADFTASRHGVLLEEGRENAPDCFSCHSNHYTAKKTDPEARVHPDRIRETCEACHPGEAGRTAAASWWAGGRFSGHGKSDLSEVFSVRNCRDCHFGPDTHRTPPPEERALCAACHVHSVDEGDASPSLVGSVHLASEANFGEVFSVVRGAGFFIILLGIVVTVLPAVLLGIRLRRDRQQRKEGAGGE